MPADILSKSVDETHALGERVGRGLQPGDVVGLIGELGSGKTTFIQGLAKGLGVNPDAVKSPTFVLMREYTGRVPVVHMDGYRLDDANSVVWLDLDLVFSPYRVTLIEWADRVAAVLPEDYLEIRFAHKSTNHRTMQLIGHGDRSQAVVNALAKVSPGRG